MRKYEQAYEQRLKCAFYFRLRTKVFSFLKIYTVNRRRLKVAHLMAKIYYEHRRRAQALHHLRLESALSNNLRRRIQSLDTGCSVLSREALK